MSNKAGIRTETNLIQIGVQFSMLKCKKCVQFRRVLCRSILFAPMRLCFFTKIYVL